jgi:CRP-like cAMP-binding protein
LWAPLSWTVGFAGLNLFQSWRLFLERRPIQLTAEEEEVRRLAFGDVAPRKFLQILGIGVWSTNPSGERLVESGKAPAQLALIVRGTVRLSRAGSDIGTLGPGDFVGSALILSGLAADFDAVVEEPVRAVRWQIEVLEKYLNANPEMRIVMQRHLARELSGKVRRLVEGPR